MNATSHAGAVHAHAAGAAYPVMVIIPAPTVPRRRLSVALRPILSIPHAILVGPIYWWSRTGGLGLVGAAAYVLAFVSWCTLLFGGRHFDEIRQFSLLYLRWRLRAVTYMGLLRDEFPPFGDGTYPTSVEVVAPDGQRDIWSIAFRPILALPHLVLLALLFVGSFLATVAAWIVIVVSGRHPEPLYTFAAGATRWAIRVEAYLLLLVDEFPPFSLE
jgi:hypothetical protein